MVYNNERRLCGNWNSWLILALCRSSVGIYFCIFLFVVNWIIMDEIKKEQTPTHKIGIYLWIWGLLFVLSFFSYMVDWYQFQGLLRWSLILLFMFLKAGLIMAFFMHLFWERYALVNVLLWPMTAIACFVGLMVAEGKYTLFSRLFYFFVGGQ